MDPAATRPAPLGRWLPVLVVVTAVLVAAVVQQVGGFGSPVSRATFGVLELAAGVWSSVASARAARRLRRVGPRALRVSWGLLAVSFAAWSGGQVLFVVHDVLRDLPNPPTDWSDLLFTTHTALLVVCALARVVSLSRRKVGWRAVADGTLLALSVLTLNWVGWLAPTVHDYPGDRLDLLVPLGYPVADLVVVTLLVTALTLAGWTRAGVLLLLGTLSMTLAVCTYSYAVVTGHPFVTGGLPDYGWLVAFSSFALAAGHAGRHPVSRHARPDGVPAVLLPYLLAVPAVTVAGVKLLREPDPVEVVLVLALFAVTLTRQLVVLVDHRALLAVAEDQRAQLDRLAHVDPLTGLQNRRRFTQHLRDAVTHALDHPDAGPVTVAFVDLDHFKTVNDTLGHAAGDQLLTTVADRLRRCLRPEDHCARWGGDEFACLLTGADVAPAALEARFQQAMAEPVTIDGHTFTAGASIGVTTLAEVFAVGGGGDVQRVVDGLLGRADERMYDVKAARRGAGSGARGVLPVRVQV